MLAPTSIATHEDEALCPDWFGMRGFCVSGDRDMTLPGSRIVARFNTQFVGHHKRTHYGFILVLEAATRHSVYVINTAEASEALARLVKMETQ